MTIENAKRDENFVPTLLGVSSADGVTPIRVWADPDTHRLLVDLGAGVVGPGSSTDDAIATWDGTTGETLQNTTVTIVAGVVNATGYKAGGTAAVADGTYTVGSKITPVTGDLGTITVKGGIITAIQEAS